MGVGAHVQLYCFAVQFKMWFELLLGEVEPVGKSGDVVQVREHKIRKQQFLK